MSEYKQVLILEDDPMVQYIISEFLGKIEGYHLVGMASNLEVAKEFIHSEKIDLVLLDMYLPGGLGIDLLKYIRNEECRIDVILITADNRAETFECALRYGVVDYLIKPFRYERFEESLIRYLNNQKLLENNLTVDQALADQIMSFHRKQEADDKKNHTAENILRFLKENDSKSYTSTEIAEKIGTSRITARRYLEEMEQRGEVVLELSYGGVGRPQNCYKYNKHG